MAGVAAALSEVHEGVAREAVLQYISALSDYKLILLGVNGALPADRPSRRHDRKGGFPRPRA